MRCLKNGNAQHKFGSAQFENIPLKQFQFTIFEKIMLLTILSLDKYLHDFYLEQQYSTLRFKEILLKIFKIFE